MKANAFGNAEQDDLWAALTERAHNQSVLDISLSVKDIMDTWTLQKGYPVVNVIRNGNTLELTQNWFLLNPANKVQNNPAEYNSYRWYVPFTFTTKNIGDFSFESKTYWLKKNDTQSKNYIIA